MAALCPTADTGSGFLFEILTQMDCQAQSLGEAGYQALANPGSDVSLLLTSFLTLFIAILGIRLLFGRVPEFGDLMGWGIKVGIVLALATSWAAYRTIAYDVVLKGPGEIASSIGQSASLPGASGGLISRLDRVDEAMLSLVLVGTGPLGQVEAAERESALAKVSPPVSDGFALGMARTSFVSGLIASQGLTRLIGGVLLALAPLFAGLLLFDATRSFFFGWVRGLVAVALGSLVTALVIGVELAILEPWLMDVLTLRNARISTPNAPFELLAITLAFGIITLGGLFLSTRLAYSSDVTVLVKQQLAFAEQGLRGLGNQARIINQIAPETSLELANRTRAARLADQLTNETRLEAGRTDRTRLVTDSLGRDNVDTERGGALREAAITPLGQTYQRTTRRASAAAAQRSSTT